MNEGTAWTGRTAINILLLPTLHVPIGARSNAKSEIISWKNTIIWISERRKWSVGLRSMHEASRQQNGQENSSMLELVDQQSQRISELEGQVSELSSKCSTLMSELQQKSETIVELNGQIEKLNGSDLVLEENEQLKKQNERLEGEKQEAVQNAMTEVQAYRAEYERKEKELAIEWEKAEKAKQDAEAAKTHQESKIMVKVAQMNLVEEKHLKKAYKAKEKALHGAFLGSLLYGILCTGFTAIHSKAFVSDFKAFFVAIWSFLCLCVEKLLEAAKWTSQLGDKIPQPIVAAIVHWLILIAVILLVGGGAVFLLFLAGNYAYVHYKDGYADTISLAVILISLAVAVFFAEPIRAVVPINLLLLLILVHVLYVGVRWYIKGCRRSRGYY